MARKEEKSTGKKDETKIELAKQQETSDEKLTHNGDTIATANNTEVQTGHELPVGDLLDKFDKLETLRHFNLNAGENDKSNTVDQEDEIEEGLIPEGLAKVFDDFEKKLNTSHEEFLRDASNTEVEATKDIDSDVEEDTQEADAKIPANSNDQDSGKKLAESSFFYEQILKKSVDGISPEASRKNDNATSKIKIEDTSDTLEEQNTQKKDADIVGSVSKQDVNAHEIIAENPFNTHSIDPEIPETTGSNPFDKFEQQEDSNITIETELQVTNGTSSSSLPFIQEERSSAKQKEVDKNSKIIVETVDEDSQGEEVIIPKVTGQNHVSEPQVTSSSNLPLIQEEEQEVETVTSSEGASTIDDEQNTQKKDPEILANPNNKQLRGIIESGYIESFLENLDTPNSDNLRTNGSNPFDQFGEQADSIPNASEAQVTSSSSVLKEEEKLQIIEDKGVSPDSSKQAPTQRPSYFDTLLNLDKKGAAEESGLNIDENSTEKGETDVQFVKSDVDQIDGLESAALSEVSNANSQEKAYMADSEYTPSETDSEEEDIFHDNTDLSTEDRQEALNEPSLQNLKENVDEMFPSTVFGTEEENSKETNNVPRYVDNEGFAVVIDQEKTDPELNQNSPWGNFSEDETFKNGVTVPKIKKEDFKSTEPIISFSSVEFEQGGKQPNFGDDSQQKLLKKQGGETVDENSQGDPKATVPENVLNEDDKIHGPSFYYEDGEPPIKVEVDPDNENSSVHSFTSTGAVMEVPNSNESSNNREERKPENSLELYEQDSTRLDRKPRATTLGESDSGRFRVDYYSSSDSGSSNELDSTELNRKHEEVEPLPVDENGWDIWSDVDSLNGLESNEEEGEIEIQDVHGSIIPENDATTSLAVETGNNSSEEQEVDGAMTNDREEKASNDNSLPEGGEKFTKPVTPTDIKEARARRLRGQLKKDIDTAIKRRDASIKP